MWDQISRLDAYLRDVPPEEQLLKLSEEVGEVAEAWIGMHGRNPRKGICRTQDDLLSELADVIITAAVAMTKIAGSSESASGHLEQRIATVVKRAGLDGGQGTTESSQRLCGTRATPSVRA
jgi:NTP pyrophosphatase (non-canonical NTP hydrolase)